MIFHQICAKQREFVSIKQGEIVEAGGSFFPTKACYVFDEENGLSALKIVIGF